MRKFKNIVKQFDKGQGGPLEFTQLLFGELEWSNVIAAGWIYCEDGGKRLSFADFQRAAEGLAESEIVLDAIRHCPASPGVEWI
jgi:hypothetical protein